MKTTLLIVAALVFPLVWGYLAEQLLKRVWPRSSESAQEASSQSRNDKQTFYPDYQI
jgi:hypothetical protein